MKDFTTEEKNWLQKHPKLAADIDESLQDSLNVNRLDTGEPDLEPYEIALEAAQILLEAITKEIVEGPYDDVHLEIISRHINLPLSNTQGKKFWNLFSYECVLYKDEDETWNKERIYLEAMKELIKQIREEEFDYTEGDDEMQVANLNTNTIHTIVGKGVNAVYSTN